MPRWDATILPRIFEREIRRGIGFFGLDLPFGFVIDLAGVMLRYELIHTIYIYSSGIYILFQFFLIL